MVEVTQADRDIVDHAWLSTHEKAALARHVARHRIAAEQRGKLEGARLALEAAASRADLIIATGRTEFALGYDAGAEMAASAIRALDPAKIVGEG